MATAKRPKPRAPTRRTVMEVPEEPENDDFPDLDEADETPLTDNAYDVPLFADSDRRSLRSVASLRIFKFEQGGMVYRGQVPPTTTLDDLGEQFGDGRFAIEACNVKHRVLDRKENIRIALNIRNQHNGGGGGNAPFDHAADLERVERLSRAASEQAIQQSQDFTTLITAQMATQSQRERDAAAQALLQQTTAFQQMMTMLQTSHNQTLQRLESMNAGGAANQINPLQMTQLMMQAIRMGADMRGDGGEENETLPAWLQILGGGADLLLTTAQKKFANNALPANANTPNPPALPSGKRMTTAQQAVIRDALQLSSAITASGLTVSEALERLKSQPAVQSAPERQAEADTPEPPVDEPVTRDEFFPGDDLDDESESDDDLPEDDAGTGEPDSATDTG